jgi:hypothetical protein
MVRALAVLGGGLLMLASCVTLPVGPSVAVLPAPEKPPEVYHQEGGYRAWAGYRAV